MKKFVAMLLALMMIFSLAACGNTTPAPANEPVVEETPVEEPAEQPEEQPAEQPEEPEGYQGYVSELDAEGNYVRGDDEDIYEGALGNYEAMMAAAKEAETNDMRFVLEAQAEAYLLDSAVMQPNTTQGGAYTISRIAPRTRIAEILVDAALAVGAHVDVHDHHAVFGQMLAHQREELDRGHLEGDRDILIGVDEDHVVAFLDGLQIGATVVFRHLHRLGHGEVIPG